MSELLPAPDDPGSYLVVNGDTEQSFVDPEDPTHLEFEYVRRVGEVLDETVLRRPKSEHIRVVHLGGGGFTLPRYVQARRPGTAQTVFEPDEALTEAVRRELPLAGRANIRIRGLDGRSGVSEMPSGCADALIVDAFSGACVPAELATAGFFAETRRLLRGSAVMIMNITDSTPFEWSKRCIAGVTTYYDQVGVIAEIPVWKGRRFGNLVIVAGADLPVEGISRQVMRADFPHRLVGGQSLVEWLDGATPFTDSDAQPSPEPNWGKTWFGPRRHHGEPDDADA